ncbi:hypothetical protein [Paenibacillus aestuarii]|uniref:Uncharacterized protein n=1 Tax=Paenibacillus aestuarii TaxID=516965 RepID=A0ABW0KDQ7_9BACL|nr:hypothetical protein [Paenibacillus aestuarii]
MTPEMLIPQKERETSMFQAMKQLLVKLMYAVNRFQYFIMTLVILGLLELVFYSDVFITLSAIPEFAPFATALIIIIGVAKYVKHVKKRKSGRENDPS